MYSKFDNFEDPFKDHNKMIRTKRMVICEMGAECILQYIDKIMKQNKIKRVHFDKKILDFHAILVHYDESCPYCLLSQKIFLNLETMDVIHAP